MSTGRTLLFGLLGDPVSHSLSPYIMNRAFRDLGIDAVYMAFGVRPSHLELAVNGLYEMGASGANVTFPYKEEVLYHLDVVASDAELAQSVNTLVFLDNEVHGYNTDGPGTVAALEFFAETPVEGNTAFIYGTGGSARAAGYGLLERGIERVIYGARTRENAEMIVDRYRYAFPEQIVDYVMLDEADRKWRRDAVRSSGIVINATPVGMAGVQAGNVVEDPSWIQKHHCCFDFVYHPRNTMFLEVARSRGARTLGGLALLVSQAAESFRLWTDHSFDLKEMAAAADAFTQAAAAPGRGIN